MKAAWLTAALVGSSALSGLAQASDPPAGTLRLELSRGYQSAACPAAPALRDAVASRLGYQPFGEHGTRAVSVKFERRGGGLTSTISLIDDAGDIQGERVLSSSQGDCRELAASTALTISILLDQHLSGSPAGMEGKPAPKGAQDGENNGKGDDAAKASRHESEVENSAKEAEAEPLHLRVGAFGQVAVGVAPLPTGGIIALAGLGQGWWFLDGELRVNAAGGDQIGAYQVETSFVAGSLVPCARYLWIYGCARLSLGVIHGQIANISPTRKSSFHALLGPRLGVSLPLASWIALDSRLDASYAPTRTTLRVGPHDIWSTPDFAGLFALGLVGHWP